MLILPAEHHIGAPLAYIMHYCQEFGLKFGLTIGCFTPLCFVEESIYELDRLHIVVHGVRDKNWTWRRSALDLVRRAGKLIEEKTPTVSWLWMAESIMKPYMNWLRRERMLLLAQDRYSRILTE